MPTLDAIAPLQVSEPWELSEKKSVRTSNHRALWLAVFAALVLIAGTAAYLRVGGAVSKARDVSAIALKASDAVGSAVVSGISSVTERAGLGRRAPKDSSGAVPPAPAAPVETPSAPPIVRKAAATPKPPMKDGRPVSYQKIIWMAFQ